MSGTAAPGRPARIWSHRGRVEPGRSDSDNTAAGVAAAIAAGADGVEIDTWSCADGAFVLTHDRDTPAGPVDLCRSGALGHLDPLEAVLGAAGTATLNVELKVPPGSTPAEQARLGQSLRERLESFVGARPRPVADLVVSSFSEPATRPFLGAGLPVRVGHLCETVPDRSALEALADAGYWGLHFLAAGSSEAGLARTDAAGLVPVAWTVNDPRQAATLIRWGAQVIISDVPGVLRHAMHP